MKLKPWQVWAVKQALGTDKGSFAVSLLQGPLGAMIDLASKGKVSEALGKIDDIVSSIREVIG